MASPVTTIRDGDGSNEASSGIAGRTDDTAFDCPEKTDKMKSLSNPTVMISEFLGKPPSKPASSSAVHVIDAIGFDGESDRPNGTEEKDSIVLHESRSFQEIPHRLSQHSSPGLLLNPTVIYRPKLESRPTVLSATFSQQVDNAINGKEVFDLLGGSSSSPSQLLSVASGSSPPQSLQSTAPTSLTSSGAPRSADTAHKAQQRYNSIQAAGSAIYEPAPSPSPDETDSQWLVFPKEHTPRLSAPSVMTVEKAAAAKIFLESHFDALLAAKPSPRSLRRRHMEREMFMNGLPWQKRIEQRQQWETAESRHLRETRLLKSKTLVRQSIKGVHASQYEIVRVLGKGSFGVVRLVREKSDCTDNSFEPRIEGSGNNSNMVGVVSTVSCGTKRKSKKQVYAMKVIRKSEMLRNSQEGHLRAERDFLVASENSRWVVPLLASFQDNLNLYLVMEYMIGGDFLGLLLREDILDENVAKWYVAEMILGIEEAHKMNWIHRDIKPDNFLITASGHLKISDFGLAFDGHWAHNQTYYNEHRYRLLHDLDLDVEGDATDRGEHAQRREARKVFDFVHGKSTGKERVDNKEDGANNLILDWLNRTKRRQFAKSVVGTSQYMAPEVIRGENYDGRCDWWSIGIILYEVGPRFLTVVISD